MKMLVCLKMRLKMLQKPIKEIKEQKKQQLLKDQENQAKAAAKRQQEYFNSVVNEIKGMDDIRGIKIPEKDKKALLEYIFKPDAEGKTQYQKDWSKSVKNLLESAYFTMKGDTLLKQLRMKVLILLSISLRVV